MSTRARNAPILPGYGVGGDGFLAVSCDSKKRPLDRYWRRAERRGVTLRQLAAETNQRELWAGLEESNLSVAAASVRAQLCARLAERVGLDPDEVVNEFCRRFQNGRPPRGRLMRGPRRSSLTNSTGKTCRHLSGAVQAIARV